MQKDIKNKILAIGVLIFVVGLTIGIIQLVGVGIDWLRKKLDLPNTSNPGSAQLAPGLSSSTPERVQLSQNSDFDFYNTLNKIALSSSTESWVNKNGKVEGRIYKKFIRVDGDISNAYLFVEVSVDNNKPLTVWDSIYVSLRKEVGGYLYEPVAGHLLRSKSLNIPPSNTTRLLYDMQQIPFTTIPYSDNNNFVNKNWLSNIQTAKTFQFETFLSTSRKGGKIVNISIGYQCAQETPNCKLEVIQ